MPPIEGKILIVDDDADARETFSMFTSMAGFESLSAADKEAALKLIPNLGELGVGAVLLDGNLSPQSRNGTDGIELNAKIKELYGNRVKTAGISATDPITGADVEQMSIGSPRQFLQELKDL